MSAPKVIDLFEALKQSLDAAKESNESKVEQLRLRLVRLREDAECAKDDYLTTCNEVEAVSYSTEAVDAWFARVNKQRKTWLKCEAKAHEAWDEWADATAEVTQ